MPSTEAEKVAMGRHVEGDRGLNPETLGEAIRMLRHRAQLTRDALAKLAGVSAGAISNYENDVTAPAAPALRRICEVLATNVDRSGRDLWDQFGRILEANSSGAPTPVPAVRRP